MALSFKLTSTDFRGVVNRRFWANFLPFPATNQFYFDVGTPNFKLRDITHDRDLELRDYREKTPLILAFTRIFTAKQYCPFCFPHILELSQRYDEFRALGFEVLLITSTDRVQSQIVARDLGLKMPLLSDPSCHIFRAYRVGQALGAPLPAQFLLDRDGKLRYRHLFSFIEPNAPIDRLLELAQPWSLVNQGIDQTVNAIDSTSIAQRPAETDQTTPSDSVDPVNPGDSVKTPDNAAPTAPEIASVSPMVSEVNNRVTIETPQTDPMSTPPETEAKSALSPTEIVEPKLEPMPDTSQAIAFAAKSVQPIDGHPLETIEPEVEPLPNSMAIAPIQRRQPWLDDATEETAIEGEIVRDRRNSSDLTRRRHERS